MAKTGNTLGKLIATPVISATAEDANPAVVAETPKEKRELTKLKNEIEMLAKKR